MNKSIRTYFTALLGGVLAVAITACTQESGVTEPGPPAGPGPAASLSLDGGNNQTGVVGAPLQTPISVTVADQGGMGVPGEAVAFSVTGGGGSVNPTSATTDANGIASATWTLGAAEGANTAEASASGLSGSPVAFTATGANLVLTSVIPNPLVEGASATFAGSGFDPTPANNSVMIDGVAAVVTAAAMTSLTVTIPAYDCRPARDVSMTVTVSGETTNAVSQRLHPASPVTLAVGQQQILGVPEDFCLQFLADNTGGDGYLVGVSAPGEVDASMVFRMVATAGVTSAPGLVPHKSQLLQPAPTPARQAVTPAELAVLQRERAYRTGEMRLRQWERDHLDPATHPELWAASRTPAAAAAQVVPNVGDPLNFNVPDIEGNLCTDFTTVSTIVRKVGTRGIIAEDVNNPPDDPFTDADLQSFSDVFDNDIYDVLVANFSTPTDIDANGGRVIIVLTKQVNAFQLGIAGFVTSSDLLAPASCASSNQGEIFYGYVPDPMNASMGRFAHDRADVVGSMPALIAHEVTHTIQQTRRSQAGASFMAAWEAEGQADLAKELLGFAQRGEMSRQNYDGSKLTNNGLNDALYSQRFSRLAQYFGWDPSTNGQFADAPHACSLFGFSGTPCETVHYYGASWSMHRMILDRFGPSYTGGEQALARDWIGANPTQSGRDNIEALLGVDFDDLFAQWAAMLYLDGRVTGLASELQMQSWNLADIYDNVFAAELSLQPTQRTFGAFTEAATVRGGSTHYTLLTATGARGAYAIRLRDGTGSPLGSTLRPRFWIVRTQ